MSEGLHGVAFADPLGRTREYVDVVRMALRREPVEYHGEHFTLPLPDGPGKALKLTIRPAATRPADLPRGGRAHATSALAGEVADGWLARLPLARALRRAYGSRARRARGRRRGGAGRPDGRASTSSPPSPSSSPTTSRPGRAAVADYTALYIGGMGSREQNFYNRLARRMGFEDAADRIQDLYLDGRPRDAAAAVPFELVDATALIGPPERIARAARPVRRCRRDHRVAWRRTRRTPRSSAVLEVVAAAAPSAEIAARRPAGVPWPA